jgi:hypothetical protein
MRIEQNRVVPWVHAGQASCHWPGLAQLARSIVTKSTRRLSVEILPKLKALHPERLIETWNR